MARKANLDTKTSCYLRFNHTVMCFDSAREVKMGLDLGSNWGQIYKVMLIIL